MITLRDVVDGLRGVGFCAHKMPMQPVVDGRFVENGIVRRLLEEAPIGMNEISCMDFSQEERQQFAQLIGYSVSGYGELDYVTDESYDKAVKANGRQVNSERG